MEETSASNANAPAAAPPVQDRKRKEAPRRSGDVMSIRVTADARALLERAAKLDGFAQFNLGGEPRGRVKLGPFIVHAALTRARALVSGKAAAESALNSHSDLPPKSAKRRPMVAPRGGPGVAVQPGLFPGIKPKRVALGKQQPRKAAGKQIRADASPVRTTKRTGRRPTKARTTGKRTGTTKARKGGRR